MKLLCFCISISVAQRCKSDSPPLVCPVQLLQPLLSSFTSWLVIFCQALLLEGAVFHLSLGDGNSSARYVIRV